MGWSSELMRTKVAGGIETATIVGTIGDKLTVINIGTFPADAPFDFRGHTWKCQIRHAIGGPLAAELSLVSDDTDATSISLTWTLADSTVLLAGREYLLGVKAVEGPYADWTLERGIPLVGLAGVVSSDP